MRYQTLLFGVEIFMFILVGYNLACKQTLMAIVTLCAGVFIAYITGEQIKKEAIRDSIKLNGGKNDKSDI